MTTDYRALCAELVDELDYQTSNHEADELIDRARAALAEQPVSQLYTLEPPADGEVPEGPSDEDLDELAEGFMCIAEDGTGFVDDHVEFARAALSRWGHPATPNRPPLSPAAQAVPNAVTEICPAPADEIAAAALRAAADQVAPHLIETGTGWKQHRSAVAQRLAIRRQLLAIAAELEGHHG
jgi:hypothetical protein